MSVSREVRIENGLLLLNGKPLLIRGALTVTSIILCMVRSDG
ncbi:hypothetical protein [Klebsiella pneumoniae]